MTTEYGWQWKREHTCQKPYLWFAKAGQQWRCPRKTATGDRCGKLWEVIVDPDHGSPKKLTWREVAESTPDGRLERFERVGDDELWYWLTEEMDLPHRDTDVNAETLIEAVRKPYHRLLTVRERARAQGFPDHYEFEGSPSKQVWQIGNAVSVGVARWFGDRIIQAFA